MALQALSKRGSKSDFNKKSRHPNLFAILSRGFSYSGSELFTALLLYASPPYKHSMNIFCKIKAVKTAKSCDKCIEFIFYLCYNDI